MHAVMTTGMISRSVSVYELLGILRMQDTSGTSGVTQPARRLRQISNYASFVGASR